jgi:sugar phosphate isomerase/epimerase
MTDLSDMIHLGGTARSPEDVRRLHNLGLQFAELPVTDPDKFSNLVKKYKHLTERLGIYYLCHGPREGDPNDMDSLDKQYLPKVYDVLRLMTDLDMSLLTLHLWLDERFVKPNIIDFKIGLLRRIIRRAEEAGITVCLENLSENSSHMTRPFHDLPLLCMTLDLGHAQLLTDRNTSYEYIKKYPERNRHIHIHDNRGGNSHLDDLHLPPGEGIVDFEKIFKGLKEIGYSRTITLELKPHEIEKCLDSIKALLARYLFG